MNYSHIDHSDYILHFPEIDKRKLLLLSKSKIFSLNISGDVTEAKKSYFEWLDNLRNFYEKKDGVKWTHTILNTFFLNLSNISEKKSNKTYCLHIFQSKIALDRFFDENKNIFKSANIVFDLIGSIEMCYALKPYLVNSFSNSVFFFNSKRESMWNYILVIKKYFFIFISNLKLIYSFYLKLVKIKNSNSLANNSWKIDTNKIAFTVDDDKEIIIEDSNISSRYFPSMENLLNKNNVGFIPLILESKPSHKFLEKNTYKISLFYQKLSSFQFLIIHFKSLEYILKSAIILMHSIFSKKNNSFNFNHNRYMFIFNLLNLMSRSLNICTRYYRITNFLKRANVDVLVERKPFSSSGRISILASRGNCISVGLQHGVVNNNQLGYSFTSKELDKNRFFNIYDVLPDKMFVFGERMKSHLLKQNFPPNKIIISGNFKYNNRFFKRFDGCHDISDKTQFLYIMQCGGEELKCHLDILIGALFYFKHINLVIRPHPLRSYLLNEAFSHLDNLSFPAERISVSNSSNIFDAFDHGTIVFSHSSTSILDSIYAGVPVVILDITSIENNNSLFIESESFVSVKDSHELISYLSKGQICVSPDAYRFLEWQVSTSSSLNSELIKIFR